jgi:signal transduction histidine kinase
MVDQRTGTGDARQRDAVAQRDPGAQQDASAPRDAGARQDASAPRDAGARQDASAPRDAGARQDADAPRSDGDAFRRDERGWRDEGAWRYEGARRWGRWWRGPAWWWRRRSLRARLTIITSAGLALALGAAAVLLLGALRLSLVRSLDDSARQGALGVAALADSGQLPDPVPVGAGTITIQVLDAQGRITDASSGADRLVPLLPPNVAIAIAQTGQSRTLSGPPLGMPSLLQVVAVRASDGRIVIAAVSYAQAEDSITTLARVLLIGTPLLFALLALVIWLITGYTLRPIAELRKGAAEVTQTGVPRDLPVPPARDEVRSLAVTLNDMLSRLAAAQQRQRDLVSDTAHELRSPIASIRTQLEVALDHPDGLAEDLLLLARLDEQGLTRPGKPTDLCALCGSVAERYAAARVPVLADAPGSYLVLGDPDALSRVLVNLLDNAVRHAASQVTVSVRRDGGSVLLTVRDDGPGIPARDIERAFGRFSRLDSARSRTGDAGGAGLGLAIVRAAAKAHGGTAHLRDAGPGLLAEVRLPLAAAT